MQGDDEVLRTATSKAIRRIVPFTMLMFVLSFLDRVNVGFAKQGLQRDAGIGDYAFAMGLSLFFIGYALFETPSNLVMHRVGARRWMARIMVTWGLVSAAMMFVNSTPLFYGLRFLLGVAEAGFFPGVALYFTLWFPARVRAQALGLFYFGLCLAFVIGGPVSGALLELEGVAGLHGWQWLFLVEGLLASLVGVIAFWYLTDRPADAAWLTAPQRRALKAELDREEGTKEHGAAHGPGRSLLAVLLDPRVLYCSLVFFISQIGLYGVVFYLPAQISQIMGRGIGFAVGSMSAVPWVCALLACATVPRWSDRTGERRLTATACIAVGTAGILLAADVLGPWAGFAGLCLAAAGIVSLQPIYFTFPMAYLGGRDAAAGLGIITSLGALGGFVAPNLRVWAEHAFNAPAAGLYAICAISALNVVLIYCFPLLGLDAGKGRQPVAASAPINPAGQSTADAVLLRP